MKAERLAQLQTEAYQAYNRLPGEDAGPYAVAVAACEIALQLQRLNERLGETSDLQYLVEKVLHAQLER